MATKEPAKYIGRPDLNKKPAQIYFNPKLFAGPVNLLGQPVKWKTPATPQGPGKQVEVRGVTLEDVDLIYEYEKSLGVSNPHFRINPEWERWNERRKTETKTKKEDSEKSE